MSDDPSHIPTVDVNTSETGSNIPVIDVGNSSIQVKFIFLFDCLFITQIVRLYFDVFHVFRRISMMILWMIQYLINQI